MLARKKEPDTGGGVGGDPAVWERAAAMAIVSKGASD